MTKQINELVANPQYGGMNLRDYFAAQIISEVGINGLYQNGDYLGDEYAKRAYQLADSMLIARNSKSEIYKCVK